MEEALVEEQILAHRDLLPQVAAEVVVLVMEVAIHMLVFMVDRVS